MMNTLANHEFLPHNGNNLTREAIVKGLGAALNFNASLASLMFDMAVSANPEPNATYFTLDHLNRHNVLEHDASLSRTDAFFGNNHIFNQIVFDETKTYWTGACRGELAIASRAFNPTYTFTTTTEEFSLGELAAPVIAFGDMDSGLVNRTLVEYFFENERLPTELGWSTKTKVVSQDDVAKVANMVRNATSLFTPIKAAAAAKSRELHFGI
ncbi:Cloroperoxidase [Whalleya microplaca]|nr:Cloroperoxidase [Whalleya microplaca]